VQKTKVKEIYKEETVKPHLITVGISLLILKVIALRLIIQRPEKLIPIPLILLFPALHLQTLTLLLHLAGQGLTVLIKEALLGQKETRKRKEKVKEREEMKKQPILLPGLLPVLKMFTLLRAAQKEEGKPVVLRLFLLRMRCIQQETIQTDIALMKMVL
jgi:hypothetical protein